MELVGSIATAAMSRPSRTAHIFDPNNPAIIRVRPIDLTRLDKDSSDVSELVNILAWTAKAYPPRSGHITDLHNAAKVRRVDLTGFVNSDILEHCEVAIYHSR